MASPDVGQRGVFLAGGADFSSMQNAVGGMLGTLGSFAGKLGVAAGALAGFAAAMVPAIKQANRFQENVAELEKLVGSDLARPLAVSIEELSTRLPVARQRLFDVAQSAVRLGVRGRENILAFTETMAEIEVATDLTADVAAEQFARIAAVTGTPIERIGDLADTINALSNQMATSFSEIVQSMGELAPALSQIGTPAEDIAALAASVNEVNISVSKGARRLRSFFQQIRDVGNAEDLARALNLSRERFIQLTESGDGAQQVLIRVLETMREGGEDARLLRSTLRNAANQGAGALTLRITALQRAMLTATDAMSDSANSLEEEFGAFFETASSQTQILQNQIDQLQRQAGDDFLQMEKSVLEFAQSFLELIDLGDELEDTLPTNLINAFNAALDAVEFQVRNKDIFKAAIPFLEAIDRERIKEQFSELFFRLEGAQRRVFTESFLQRIRDAQEEMSSTADVMAILTMAARDAAQASAGPADSLAGALERVVDAGAITTSQADRILARFRQLKRQVPIGQLAEFEERATKLGQTFRETATEDGADISKLLTGLVRLLEDAAAGFRSAGEEAEDAAESWDDFFGKLAESDPRLARTLETFVQTRRELRSLNTELVDAGDRSRVFGLVGEKLNERMADLRRHLEGTGISVERFRGSLASLTDREFAQLLTRIDMVNRAAEGMAEELGDAFVDVITDTQSVVDAFADMVDGILREITRLLVRQAITQPLAQFLSGVFAGLAGGGASGNVTQAGVSDTGLAHGGFAAAGRPVMVGERGPELFVPPQAGEVVPNRKLRGAGGDRIEINVRNVIHAADTEGIRRLVNSPEFQRGTVETVVRAAEQSGRFSQRIVGG